MSLSSLQLDAFLAVARERSFSGAAKRLHLTQSALSQRVLNLEEELGSTLFLREPAGLRITEMGEKLLRYCQTKEKMESEILGTQSGNLRVAGFSTVVRPLLVPTITRLLRQHPGAGVELLTAEFRDLPTLLSTGGADFILVDRPPERQGMESTLLGHEENVLLRPRNKKFPEDVFLDHDEEDRTTEDFFRLQSRKPKAYRRLYFDEMYTILDGVKAGLGRTVGPRFLAEGNGLEIENGYKPLRVPVYVAHYAAEFLPTLSQDFLKILKEEANKLLS